MVIQFGKILIGITGGLVILAGIGWLGLKISPANLPLPNDEPQDFGIATMPTDLPAPVQRYLQASLGDQPPRIESLVVCGRAKANFGMWTPIRYQLVHHPGYAFERYMEVTWFGIPVLKALDRYVDGVGMTGPIGKETTGKVVDQAANMILWAEAPLMPSLWMTDERIRWEAVDDTTARLIFPFEDEEDALTVHFDPESALITHMTALRYRDEASGKVPWRVDFLTWNTVDGRQLPARIAVTWEDQGEPWSYWELEDFFWNVDISAWLPTKHSM